MIKLISVCALSVMMSGCVAYTGTYHPSYNSYGQVTSESVIVAPSHIKNQDGTIESAPNGTIYFGRTAPEPIYMAPYNRAYIQPQYKPSIIKR